MKKSKFLAAASIIGLASIFSSAAQASAECGIWLCLPSSFPSAAGCAASKAAMLDRVRQLKSPLPAFSSCSASGQDEGHDFVHGSAAYVPRSRVCVQHGYRGDGAACLRYRDVPAHYVEGKSCRIHHESGIREPKGCTRTYQFVRIFANGTQEGETYYW